MLLLEETVYLRSRYSGSRRNEPDIRPFRRHFPPYSTEPFGKRYVMSMNLSIAVPCMMHALSPDSAGSVRTVLERIGLRCFLPKTPACCGQPAYNSGYRTQALQVARHFLRTYETADAIIFPSGSCVHMIRHGYPELFQNDPSGYATALDIAKRTYEFTEFLVDFLHIDDVGSRFPTVATYHDSCHLSRGLGIRDQPRSLLSKVRDLQLIEMKDSDRCCGFGGTFSVKYSDISTALCDDKIDAVLDTGAQTVVGADMGCLVHIQGRLAAIGSTIRVMHIAQILAHTE